MDLKAQGLGRCWEEKRNRPRLASTECLCLGVCRTVMLCFVRNGMRKLFTLSSLLFVVCLKEVIFCLGETLF